MDKKNKSTNSKLDDLAGLKEILTLNGNMMEFLKTVIKQRNNENALKMLDIISEKPDVWHEYLAVRLS